MSGPENGSRATMRDLNEKADLIRAEQRTEHVRTRALVVVASTPAWAKLLLPTLVGFLGWWHF